MKNDLEKNNRRELQKVEKSWNEAKGLAVDRTKLKSFMKALFSIQEQQERRGRSH
jgi:hypothetical protein